MNFENYLSLRKVLHIAMPCLALSLLMASCSNEEATGASNEITSPATNLTLTATVPVAKQSFSTRIGIDDDKIVNNANADEPYVWLEGEKLTLYWKNLHDPSADKVIEFVVSGVTGDRQGCTMKPVDPQEEILDGFYKIHSLSPHTELNFVNGELTATIDLGNRNQPSDAVDHSYLSDKMYQYATTVVQVHDGAVISGTTNLPFEFITSLMRVRVVNNTGLSINVSKVKLYYSTEDNPQFYSKGIFTANEFVGAHSYEAVPGATLNDLSITTSKELAKDESFNVYMSFFPTAGYMQGSAETLNMVVEYVVNEIEGDLIREVSVNHASFKKGTTFLSFEGGDRHLLTLTINTEDLPDGAIPPPPASNFVQHNGYEYTYNQVSDISLIKHTSGQYVYVAYGALEIACPAGFVPLNLTDLLPLSVAERSELYQALGPDYCGTIRIADPTTIFDPHFIYFRYDNRYCGRLEPNRLAQPGAPEELWFKPICRRLAVEQL